MTAHTDNTRSAYIGRFAPSPSGPLHLGSLYTAVASYLDARAQRGRWLLRIEDIDPPREQPGASAEIIACLKAHALHWDGDILWQSRQSSRYQRALSQLAQKKLLFACGCTRKYLKQHPNYPGDCRLLNKPLDSPNSSLRLNTQHAALIQFNDRLQGPQHFSVQQTGGDFIVRRKDGLIAYHLAVSVDDAHQGISHVVRGIDLLDNSAAHIYLQHTLSLPTPLYAHLPVVVDSTGLKLSKQYGAPAVDIHSASTNLRLVLALLRQAEPPAKLTLCTEILAWACAHWQPQHLYQLDKICLN